MPTLLAQPTRRQPRPPLIRPRAPQPAAVTTPAAPVPAASALSPCVATHDFLVFNPRPDLTLDRQTLRMLETG